MPNLFKTHQIVSKIKMGSSRQMWNIHYEFILCILNKEHTTGPKTKNDCDGSGQQQFPGLVRSSFPCA
jgi:hypothetical protein